MSFALEEAERLLGCFSVQLNANPNPPALQCLRVGDVAADIGTADDVCCRGMAWVRVVRIFPSTALPDVQARPERCHTTRWGIELQMGVFRCYPFGTVKAGPTCTEVEAVAEQLDWDAQAMRRAVCCLRDASQLQLVVPGVWTTEGPLGACIAGVMPVTMMVDCQEC